MTEQTDLIANRYRVTGHLGEGGMALVYQGEDTRTQTPVAIKMLKPQMVVDNPLLLERFRREAEALYELDHPNIVRVLDFVSQGSQHIIIMEYVDGGSLRDLLKKQPRLSLQQATELLLDISDALIRAHRLKIIHRDIKPDNILLTPQGVPRLSDFGTAHMADMQTITAAGAFIGTINYTSPEALRGGNNQTSNDIWSCGIMLYEMLTSFRPFMGQNFKQILMAIINQPVPDLQKLRPDAPPDLVKLVHSMLEKDPAQRVGSMRQVGAYLELILENL
ncbi:MAG: serine/threonine protein kinase [Aggregatilineales bacterium]